MSYTAYQFQVVRNGQQMDSSEENRIIHLRMLASALIAGDY